MRILQIRFKNLNSLTGEWEIDLTGPAYTSDGLFAITGPTGAGKSTLLDAVCLALYGRTPRQSRISQAQNEVMSRQTGECFAEVVFETPQGAWRCHWSQHRSRKQADGSLQPPRHEVSDAEGGKLLATKIKDVSELIERLSGMDFERFTRSMLLAQGSFAAFLQADPDARAPILEQITGTSIYSDISVAVHERRGQERQQLEHLRAAQAGLKLLDEEEAETLSRELARLNEAVEAQQKQVDQQQKLVHWRQQLDQENEQLKQLQQDQQHLEQERQAFASQQQRLEQAQKAESLRPEYVPLVQRRTDLNQARKKGEQLRQELPTLEQAHQTANTALQQAQEHQQAAEAHLTQHQPLIKQLREQDYAVSLKRDAWQQLKAQLPAELLQGPAPDPAALQAAMAKTEADLQDAISEGGRDQLKDQQEQVRIRGESLRELRNLVRQQTELKQEQQGLIADQTPLQAQQTEVTSQAEQGRQQLELLQREQQDLHTMQRLADRIADLEQQRHELEPGKPCPLCGSEQHPWRIEKPPALSEERKRLQLVEQQLEKLQGQLRQWDIKQAELNTRLQTGQKRGQVVEQKLAALDAPVNACLQQLDWAECPDTDRLEQAYQAAGEQWKQLKARLDRIDRLEAEQKQQQQTQQRQQQRLDVDAAEAALIKLQQQRAEMSPETDTEDWVKRLEKAVAQARQQVEQCREALNRCEQSLNQRRQQITDADSRIQALEAEVEQMQSAFTQSLAQSSFANEAALEAALLPREQMAALQQTAQALQERTSHLNALKSRSEQALAVLQEQALTEEPAQQLLANLQQLKATQAQQLEQRGSLQQTLKDNEAKKQQFGEQQQAIAAQQRELDRWEQLHALIGSADGKKFRNFAQGLTFELMVSHANRQLQKMSDRYLLARDEAQPLELNVIDNYQAGEVRSTKNLSGGESFLISLSLALGLSGMASRNVRVDSLFLDEGFGTLDEEALETALDTLSGLQQEGKLIGVISHVQALKERISTRIEVQPLSGGRSQIAGPGCRRCE